MHVAGKSKHHSSVCRDSMPFKLLPRLDALQVLERLDALQVLAKNQDPSSSSSLPSESYPHTSATGSDKYPRSLISSPCWTSSLLGGWCLLGKQYGASGQVASLTVHIDIKHCRRTVTCRRAGSYWRKVPCRRTAHSQRHANDL